jgi:hypothetical protein
MGRAQREQPSLVGQNARFREALQRERLLGERLAEGDSALVATRTFSKITSATLSILPKAPLGILESAALAQQHVGRGQRTWMQERVRMQ